MLISVIWGCCVVLGKCDVENSVAVDKQDTRGLSLTGNAASFMQFLCNDTVILQSMENV